MSLPLSDVGRRSRGFQTKPLPSQSRSVVSRGPNAAKVVYRRSTNANQCCYTVSKTLFQASGWILLVRLFCQHFSKRHLTNTLPDAVPVLLSANKTFRTITASSKAGPSQNPMCIPRVGLLAAVLVSLAFLFSAIIRILGSRADQSLPNASPKEQLRRAPSKSCVTEDMALSRSLSLSLSRARSLSLSRSRSLSFALSLFPVSLSLS